MIIVKYKFDNTTYDLIPTFNSGFTYTHTDTVEGNVTTRTIESDVLPTKIQFGNLDGSSSLLEVLEIDTKSVTNMSYMFRNCNALTSLDVSNFDTSNVTTMSNMFQNCNKLTYIGMIYCNTNSVNSIAQNIQYACTIYVDENLINQFNNSSLITYKPYTKIIDRQSSKVLYLNSPLLIGDTIEHRDGKVYHVHRYEIRPYVEGDEATYLTDLANTVYPLAEPVYEEIAEGEMQLRIFDDSEIQTYSNIRVPNTNITYPTTIPSVYEISSISDEQDMMLVDMATQMAIMQLTM